MAYQRDGVLLLPHTSLSPHRFDPDSYSPKQSVEALNRSVRKAVAEGRLSPGQRAAVHTSNQPGSSTRRESRTLRPVLPRRRATGASMAWQSTESLTAPRRRAADASMALRRTATRWPRVRHGGASLGALKHDLHAGSRRSSRELWLEKIRASSSCHSLMGSVYWPMRSHIIWACPSQSTCFYHTLRPLVDRLYRYIAVELADRAHEVLVARNPGFERCGFQFWALFVPTITVAFTKMPSGYALLDGARRRLA